VIYHFLADAFQALPLIRPVGHPVSSTGQALLPAEFSLYGTRGEGNTGCEVFYLQQEPSFFLALAINPYKKMPQIAAIQMTSTPDLKRNLEMAAFFIKQAAINGANLVVLPENFPLMGANDDAKLAIKETFGGGPIQDFLASQARQHKIWIVAGTIPIQTEQEPRARAACIVYNDQGQPVARYDKIHLFDVRVTPGSEEYRESDSIAPGDQVTLIETPIGKLGLAVCYDLRFPELFRALVNQGAEVIAVPSAFTVKTGIAHWEVLARSRAIENLVYGVYAGQTGAHSASRSTYGHSMIVDPWGKILQQLGGECGTISAEIDLDYLRELRQNLPVLDHRRL